jgi:hypothetical protein
MNEKQVIGLAPWLPPPLSRLSWWTEPVRAERLAALRIGVAAVLLVDLLVTYLPHLEDLFAAGGLGGASVFPGMFGGSSWNWSLFKYANSPALVWSAFIVWLLAAVCLLIGLASRLSAAVAWALAVSFYYINPYAVNAGDIVRIIILFFLMISACGAVWSVDARLRKRISPSLKRERGDFADASGSDRVFIHPWPLRLLFVQLVLIYFLNGLAKNIPGSDWWSGETVYAILAHLAMSRFPYNSVPVPHFLTQLLTWAIFLFEMGFPLWAVFPRTRTAALCAGAAFHLGLAVFMEVIMFPWYMLCLYLPLVPWERVADKWLRRSS